MVSTDCWSTLEIHLWRNRPIAKSNRKFSSPLATLQVFQLNNTTPIINLSICKNKEKILFLYPYFFHYFTFHFYASLSLVCTLLDTLCLFLWLYPAEQDVSTSVVCTLQGGMCCSLYFAEQNVSPSVLCTAQYAPLSVDCPLQKSVCLFPWFVPCRTVCFSFCSLSHAGEYVLFATTQSTRIKVQSLQLEMCFFSLKKNKTNKQLNDTVVMVWAMHIHI